MSHDLENVVDIWNKRSRKYQRLGGGDNEERGTDVLTRSSDGLIEEEIAYMAG